MTHPYKNLPSTSFWTKSVSSTSWENVFLECKSKFKIKSTDIVASAGSCFAQRISTFLKSENFNYFNFEPPHPIIDASSANQLGYNLFSARYGNIYSIRQLRQLIDECLEIRSIIKNFEFTANGKVKDLLRPGIHGEGWESIEEAEADRVYHISRVKFMLLNMNVFIFTLGLTEQWLDYKNNVIYGTHPSVTTSKVTTVNLDKINLDYNDNLNDLIYCINLIRQINPSVRFILTVSPVALVASHQSDHVLISNYYSKSILRAVAGKICSMADYVDYFMSYEIFNASQSFGQYLSQDLRDVNQRGVNVAMHLFKSIFCDHIFEKSISDSTKLNVLSNNEVIQSSNLADIECDEILNSVFN